MYTTMHGGSTLKGEGFVVYMCTVHDLRELMGSSGISATACPDLPARPCGRRGPIKLCSCKDTFSLKDIRFTTSTAMLEVWVGGHNDRTLCPMSHGSRWQHHASDVLCLQAIHPAVVVNVGPVCKDCSKLESMKLGITLHNANMLPCTPALQQTLSCKHMESLASCHVAAACCLPQDWVPTCLRQTETVRQRGSWSLTVAALQHCCYLHTAGQQNMTAKNPICRLDNKTKIKQCAT